MGFAIPAVQAYPEALELSTGPFLSEGVAWINVNFFDTLEAIKNAVLLNVLIPFKRLLGELPWFGVVGAARLCRLAAGRIAARGPGRRYLRS